MSAKGGMLVIRPRTGLVERGIRGRKRTTIGRVILLAVAAFAAAACEPPHPGDVWTTTADTLPSGAVRVVNAPPGPTAPPTWTLEEEARIGTRDQPGPASFGQLKGLVVTSEGDIVVLDAQAQEIRVFGPDGSHRSTFGGKGGGPGELADAWGLMLAPDGELWVPELGNARMSVFHPRDGFRRSFPLEVFSFRFLWDGLLAEDGRVLKPSITPGPPRRRILRVYGREMQLLDSLPLPEPPATNPTNPEGAFSWESTAGGARGYVAVPFYPQAQETLDPKGGIWSTEAGDPAYRIKHWIPGGDTLLVLEVLRPTVSIPPSERDSAIASVREFLQQRGGARQDWSKVPEVKPAVGWMFLSREGNLWVGTPSSDTLFTFDVFDRGGRYLGTAASPRYRFWPIPPVVRGDRFWAVVLDELDVPYVLQASMRGKP